MPTAIHLPGVPHVFTEYQGLVRFLRSSPGYVGRQSAFLERYWGGALRQAGYAPPRVASSPPKTVPVSSPAGIRAKAAADRLNRIVPTAKPLSLAERLHPPRPIRAGDVPFAPLEPAIQAAARAAPGPRQQEGIVGVHNIASAIRGEPYSPYGVGLEAAGLLPFGRVARAAKVIGALRFGREAEAAAKAITIPPRQPGIAHLDRIKELTAAGIPKEQAQVLTHSEGSVESFARSVREANNPAARRVAAEKLAGQQRLLAAKRAEIAGLRTPVSRAPRVGAKGATAVPKLDEPAQTVMRATGAARKAEAAQKQIYRAERAKRAGAAGKAYEQAGGGVSGHRAALGALRGPMQRVPFDRLTGLSDAQMRQLFEQIDQHPGLGEYSKLNLRGALLRAREGHAPRLSEIKMVEKVFGPQSAEEFSRHGRLLRQVGRGLLEVGNVPRAFQSTLDVSFPLRQGLAAVAYSPRTAAKVVGPMFHHLVSEKAYQADRAALERHPSYPEAVESGVQFTGLGDIPNREEGFLSNLAEKMTGGKYGPVRASARAYTGASNNFRIRLYHNMVSKARAAGVETPKLRRDTGRVVNWLTGRGELGPLERAAPILSTIFFSPRLAASRFQTFNPHFYYSLDPFVRKEAIKAATRLLAGGSVVAGAGTLAGGKVGLDPTSADFGKLRFGNTRVDIWGGHQQWARLAAQLAEGKVTSSTSGKAIGLTGGQHNLSRAGVIGRFLRTKESPGVAFAHDLLAGSSGIGKPVSVGGEVAQHTIPLLAQDVYDVYKGTRSVPAAAAAAGIGAFGVGIQNYAKPPPGKPATDKLTALVKKLGIGSQLPPAVKQSVTRAGERQDAWANATSGKKAGTRDYEVAQYKADLGLAQKWGALTRAQVARANEWLAHAPRDDIRKAHSALYQQGGLLYAKLEPARATQTWLEAQDAYATTLGQAVKDGTLTEKQANRGRVWARHAQAGEIDQARNLLERKELAPAG